MALFNYQAKDKQGILRKGSVEAASIVQASEILHSHSLTVLELVPAESGGINLDKYLPFLNRVPRKELVVFSRQLSTLINAKVPIIQALDILAEQVSSKRLQGIILEMIAEIEAGKSLSEAVSEYPNVFSNLYVHLVKAGELSGTLDRSLAYLADQQEKDYDLVAKIRGALTYPIFIVSAIVIVGGLMFIFVLPQMVSILQESGAELPLTTKILIFVTGITQKYWLVLLLLLVGAIVGFQMYIRGPGGRLIWDHVKLRIPVLGKLLRNIYMDRFALNLSTLVAGGIPIVQALKTVSDIVGNAVYKDIVEEAAQEVETGRYIYQVFEQKEEVPKLVSQMIRIGEETGSLDEILKKLASFYDKEVDNTIKTLTTLIEPVIMLLLGVAVAIIVAGVLLPIYNLASVQ